MTAPKEGTRKTGRPSGYDQPRTTDEVAAMLARQGLTVDEIAAALKVSPRTLYRWQAAHPDLWQSIREAGAETDLRVEDSLLRRCLGFTYEDDGKKRTALPDVTACRFWLANRRPDRWREVKSVEVTETAPDELVEQVVEMLCRAVRETLKPEDGDRLMRWVQQHFADIGDDGGGRCRGKRRR